MDALAHLAGARGAVVWDGDRVEVSSGFACDAGALRAGIAGLDAAAGSSELPRTDERLAPLADGAPEAWSRFLFVPGADGSASMLLALDGESAPRAADLDAVARLAAAALRPAFDEASLLETARLATTGRLAFSIAHDIGTPLNVISGYAEYLLMSVPAEDPARAGISTMLEQTRRIAQMIRQMLDVSRPPTGQARQRQAFEQFLRETLQASSYMLRKAGVKASLERVPGAETQAVGDLPRLQQALANVLLNAARLAGAGGRIVVGAAPDDGAPGVEISAVDAAGASVDLGPLALKAGGDGAQAFLEMLLALHVLETNGGTLAADGDAGRVVVRLGKQE